MRDLNAQGVTRAALRCFALDFARLTPERDVSVLLSVYPLEQRDPPLAIRGLGCSPCRDRDRPEAFGGSPGEAAFWRTVAGHHHPRHCLRDAEGGDSEWTP